jgi:hypothetical protein
MHVCGVAAAYQQARQHSGWGACRGTSTENKHGRRLADCHVPPNSSKHCIVDNQELDVNSSKHCIVDNHCILYAQAIVPCLSAAALFGFTSTQGIGLIVLQQSPEQLIKATVAPGNHCQQQLQTCFTA